LLTQSFDVNAARALAGMKQTGMMKRFPEMEGAFVDRAGTGFGLWGKSNAVKDWLR